MKENRKKIMIVDDSDIDREILRNILEADYDVLEEPNGYSALDHIISQKISIDAVMLDISMPIVDGFAVLNILKMNQVKNLPIVMITSEATRENVVRAVEFGISEFISKPFKPDVILERIKVILNVKDEPGDEMVPTNDEEELHHGDMLTSRDVEKSLDYFEKLKDLFVGFLETRGRSDKHYSRVSDIMKEVMTLYAAENPDKRLTPDHITLISKAAYLYNFGKILLSDECFEEPDVDSPDVVTYKRHTTEGAKLIRLNGSPACSYFIDICSDMCMHHHERFNGSGFPHNLQGKENSIYTSLVGMIAEFDKIFIERSMFNLNQFDFVVNQMDITGSKYDEELVALFSRCSTSVLAVYKKGDKFIRH